MTNEPSQTMSSQMHLGLADASRLITPTASELKVPKMKIASSASSASAQSMSPTPTVPVSPHHGLSPPPGSRPPIGTPTNEHYIERNEVSFGSHFDRVFEERESE